MAGFEIRNVKKAHKNNIRGMIEHWNLYLVVRFQEEVRHPLRFLRFNTSQVKVFNDLSDR